MIFNKIKVVSVFLLLLLPSTVLSQTYSPLDPGNWNLRALERLFENVGDWLHHFIIGGAMLAIIIGGGLILLSGGDPGKIATGRRIIIYSLIAVIIASLAWTLVFFVM